MENQNKKNYAVFTVCNLAYLPKALVLAESLARYDQCCLNIYIFDKKSEAQLPKVNANFIWIEDVGVPDILHLAFKYDITEFSTSLKAYIASQILEDHSKVVFLDPDTCTYQSIEPILDDLNSNPIVLTPHFTQPLPDNFQDGELGMMRFGSFNLGFFATNDSVDAIKFLKWWSDRCIRLCFFETQFGLSTDQKWVTIAPCLFKCIHISFHLGYNVAFWNIHDRIVEKAADGSYLVNKKYPLVFFHFSSFDEANPINITKRPLSSELKQRKDILEICVEYSEALKRNFIPLCNKSYGFDYMSNGDYISPVLRRAYACVYNELPPRHNPFESNGPVGRFAKANYLVRRGEIPYKPNGYSDIGKNKKAFEIIFIFLRITLRVIGPSRFSNLSRLFVYLSSARQTRGLWKL